MKSPVTVNHRYVAEWMTPESIAISDTGAAQIYMFPGQEKEERTHEHNNIEEIINKNNWCL